MRSPAFAMAAQHAVEGGLAAAAILDRDGEFIAAAGAITADEVRPSEHLWITANGDRSLEGATPCGK